MTRRRVEIPGQMAIEGFEDVPIIPVEDPMPKGARFVTPFRPRVPVRCDDCATVLALLHGNGPPTRPARWRRGLAPNDLLLCGPHMEERRRQDGLPLPRATP